MLIHDSISVLNGVTRNSYEDPAESYQKREEGEKLPPFLDMYVSLSQRLDLTPPGFGTRVSENLSTIRSSTSDSLLKMDKVNSFEYWIFSPIYYCILNVMDDLLVFRRKLGKRSALTAHTNTTSVMSLDGTVLQQPIFLFPRQQISKTTDK